MAAHAVLSPSSAHRWLTCPGSIEANRNKPWTQNIYALTGTTAHALLELCLRLHATPGEFIGKVLEKDLLPIDEQMVDAVGYALDYVHSYMADNQDARIRIEHPVYPGKLLGIPPNLLWGTPDIQIYTKRELVTIDYKHGSGVSVDVKDNPQIKLYHLGARAEFGRYHRYRSVVIQPRLVKRKPVQEHTITDVALVKWATTTVRPVIPIALGTQAPRVAGAHCRYCHEDGRCPGQDEKRHARAAQDFA